MFLDFVPFENAMKNGTVTGGPAKTPYAYSTRVQYAQAVRRFNAGLMARYKTEPVSLAVVQDVFAATPDSKKGILKAALAAYAAFSPSHAPFLAPVLRRHRAVNHTAPVELATPLGEFVVTAHVPHPVLVEATVQTLQQPAAGEFCLSVASGVYKLPPESLGPLGVLLRSHGTLTPSPDVPLLLHDGKKTSPELLGWATLAYEQAKTATDALGTIWPPNPVFLLPDPPPGSATLPPAALLPSLIGVSNLENGLDAVPPAQKAPRAPEVPLFFPELEKNFETKVLAYAAAARQRRRSAPALTPKEELSKADTIAMLKQAGIAADVAEAAALDAVLAKRRMAEAEAEAEANDAADADADADGPTPTPTPTSTPTPTPTPNRYATCTIDVE